MNPTDRLAGENHPATAQASTGAVTRQAQDRATEPAPDPAGGLRGRAAPVTPRAGAAPQSSRPRAAQRAAGTGIQPALSGAEWRKAAAKASRRRPAKAPAAAVKAPAVPLPASGARLTATANCLRGCGVIAGPGDPAEVDKAAEKHTKSGLGHPTNTVTEVDR